MRRVGSLHVYFRKRDLPGERFSREGQFLTIIFDAERTNGSIGVGIRHADVLMGNGNGVSTFL